jgi:hypothetical protein
MMKAADVLQNKLNASQGTLPTPGVGGASFTSAFAPLIDAQTHLGNIQSALSPSVLASLQSGDTTHLATVTGAVSTASTGISTSAAGSTAGVADSISTLKSYSFAKFSSMPQPAHVQNIVNSIMPTPVKYESALADARATQITSPPDPPPRLPAPILPNNLDSQPAPLAAQTLTHSSYTDTCNANCLALGYTGGYFGQPHLQFKDAYITYTQGLSDACAATKGTLDAQINTCSAWRSANIPDYLTIKSAATANPNDPVAVAAYNSAKGRFETEGGYTAVAAAQATYTAARNNVIRLRDQLDKWILAAYAGATAGPTW